jgi:predicted Zn-dependent protease
LVLLLGLSLGQASASDVQTNQFISDEEIEQTLIEWLKEIFKVAHISIEPQVLILASPEVNAGATLGELIIVYTGLILKCQNVNQLLGVLAHETGHIAGAHSARAAEAQKQALVPAVATMLLSGAAALVTGSTGPLIGGLMGGSQVFERGLLKHSRDQEDTADSAALRYLTDLNWPTSGLYEFLNILDANYTGNIDPYTSTHPLSKERKDKVKLFEKESRSTVKVLPAYEQRFQRLKAKIKGYMYKPQTTLRDYKSTDVSIAARYARAIAFYRLGRVSEALAILDSLLKENSHDPFFFELKGQILFETGKVKEAINYYREALKLLPKAKIIPMLLAQALLELPEITPHELDEAIKLLMHISEHSPDNIFAWRLLARAYGKNNKMDCMALCLSEEAFRTNNPPMAKAQAHKASKSNDPVIVKRAKDILSQIDPDQLLVEKADG